MGEVVSSPNEGNEGDGDGGGGASRVGGIEERGNGDEEESEGGVLRVRRRRSTSCWDSTSHRRCCCKNVESGVLHNTGISVAFFIPLRFPSPRAPATPAEAGEEVEIPKM